MAIFHFNYFSFFNRSKHPCFITSISFVGRNLQLLQLPSKECARSTWDNYDIQRLCSLGSTNKMDITRQRFLTLIGFIKLWWEVEVIKKTENSFENYDNHKGIIISLTSNLIDALPAGCSCSFSSIIPLFILGGTRGEKPENNVKQGYITLQYIHTYIYAFFSKLSFIS